MIDIQENVPLAPHTTLGVGGTARFFVRVESEDDVVAALGEAKRRGISVAILGAGSNVLVPESGVDGLVIQISIPGIEIANEGDAALIVGAGVNWDSVVRRASDEGLWGIENLADIPSTAGAAPVQNIGAYGTELAQVFAWADVVSRASGERMRIAAKDIHFGYRDSTFKRTGDFIITRVALALSRAGIPQLAYKDLAAHYAQHNAPHTPADIARTVRSIRKNKFPYLEEEGSAGSFFKNPILSHEAYETLARRFPKLPGFPVGGGIKVPIAWILDKALGLAGYARGAARLYEKQPIVLVATRGAGAGDVDALARDVATRVYDATGIVLEREVCTLCAK